MCGIAGWFAADPRAPVSPEPVREMCRRMAHRGPDGAGVHHQAGAVLGHRRLSIIDLSGGAQPMAGCGGAVWVTFNGEIYNHRLLRAELEAQGHVFTTRSDTEVLVHGWEAWGEALPEHLRGMFAFAIWDAGARTGFLARDRVGEKPLYWARVRGDLVFASEVKALLAAPGLSAEVDAHQLAAYLALRYVPGPATLMRGVEKLPPGHFMVFREGELRVRRYWALPVRQAPDPKLCEQEQVERFRQRFEESVRLRLMAEVPVGVFLSGGIDSTAVAWAMRKHAPGEVKSFAVGFQDAARGDDELGYARLASRSLGTSHREVWLGARRFGELVSEVAWHLDEPVADAACLPLFELCRRARQEVTVVLSGEGADEALAGYPIYRKMIWLERARRLGPLIDALAPRLARAAPDTKLGKYLALAALPLEARYRGVSRALSDTRVEALLRGQPGPRARDRAGALFAHTAGASPLRRMLHLDTCTWLPDDLLVKADKMSMAHAIELRVPFLDHELLELCWSLPDALRLRGGVGKVVLRRAMAGKLPQAVLARPKRGFPVPTCAWLRGPLHAQLRESLTAPGGLVRAVFPAGEVLALLDAHRQGQADHTDALFTLWMLEAWHARMVAPSAGAERRASA